MLDVFEFLEKKNRKPQLPPGMADLTQISPEQMIPQKPSLTPTIPTVPPASLRTQEALSFDKQPMITPKPPANLRAYEALSFDKQPMAAPGQPAAAPQQIAPMAGPQPTGQEIVRQMLAASGMEPILPAEKRESIIPSLSQKPPTEEVGPKLYKWARDNKTLQAWGKALRKAEQSKIGQTILRAGESAGQIVAPGESVFDEMPSSGNKAVDFVADLAGVIMGYSIPGGVGRTGYEAVSIPTSMAAGRLMTTKAGERVLKYMAGPKVLQELGPVPSPIKDIIGRVAARGIISGLTTGINFAGLGTLKEALSLDEAPDAEKVKKIGKSIASDFGWGLLSGAVLGGGRAIIKEAGPYLNKNSMVRQGYREIVDPSNKKGLGIYWKETKPKIGESKVEFIVTKPNMKMLETRLAYLNNYAETEFAETPRGREMVSKIKNTVDAYEIGKTGAYMMMPEKPYEKPYPRRPMSPEIKERVERISAGTATPRDMTTVKNIFGQETTMPERIEYALRAPTKLPYDVAGLSEAEKPVGRALVDAYKIARGHSAGHEEAINITRGISDAFNEQGIETNEANIRQFFNLIDHGAPADEAVMFLRPMEVEETVPELPPMEEPGPKQSMDEIKSDMAAHQAEQKARKKKELAETKEAEERQQREEAERKARTTKEMEARVKALMEREGIGPTDETIAEPAPGPIAEPSADDVPVDVPGKGTDTGVVSPQIAEAEKPDEPPGIGKAQKARQEKTLNTKVNYATGKTAKAKTIKGTEVETEYAVIDADSETLTTSHDTNMRENPAYPKELQPRDRTRATSEDQVNEIMQKMEPSWLGASPKASDGAPIVGKDGVVESGNARIIALRKLYNTGHKNAKLYNDWLADNAKDFGLDKESVRLMKKPILVRIRQTDVDRVAFTEDANERDTASMSASELARMDAKKLTGKMMAVFAPGNEGEIMTAANKIFIDSFTKNIVSSGDRARCFTADGDLSQEGVNRIRNAVFTKAYGDSSIVETLSEKTDPNIKNVLNAMVKVAPRMAVLKENIAKKTVHNIDISSDLTMAAAKLSDLRQAGRTVDDYFSQLSLVQDNMTPLARDILAVLDKHKRSAKKMSGILGRFVSIVDKMGIPGNLTLVPADVPTEAEVWTLAVRKEEGLDAVQTTLFEGEGKGDTGAGEDAGEEGTETKAQYYIKSEVETAKKGDGKSQAFSGKRQSLKYSPGGNTIKPVKRSEIVRLLSTKLNVPIRIGRFTQRAWGIFKVKPEVIRTRIANDIPTMSHEVGHYLDKELGLADKAFDAELMQLGARTSRPSYSKKQVRAEGVAEFMRLYLTEPDDLLKQAPGYYAAFENKMLANGEIHDVLLQARADIKAWMEQPAKARVLGSLSIGEKKPRKMSLERLYTATVDELRPLEKYVKEVAGENVDVERNPFVIAWLARGWTGKAETYLYHGVMDDKYNKVGPSLKEILKPLSGDLDSFRAYLVAKRAVELHGRDKRTGIDHDDAINVIKELETPAFKEAQKKVIEYQDSLVSELVDAGVISGKAAVAMRQLNQNYVPFYRVFNEQMGATYGFGKGGYGNIVSPVKKLKGSERDIVDPLESIVKNTFYMINVAERNRVGRAIVDLAQDKEGAGKWVEELPTPMHGISVNLKEIEDALEAVGVDTSQIDLDSTAPVFRPSPFPAGKENILTVYRNGNKKFYQLEPELYRATLALDKEASNMFINLLSIPAKTLRAGATLTLEFMARNPIRDIQEAMVFSNYGFNPTDFAKGLFHALKRDDIFWKWKASGGAHGAMVSLDRDYLQGSLKDLLARGAKDKALNILKNPLEVLRALSEFGEQATRIGEFAKGLKHEPQTRVGTMLASLSSRDVTLDFGRSGYAGKIPNRVVAFFNANVQGDDKIIREFRRNPNRTLLRCLLYITLPTMLLYFNNRNDKRYQELPQWQKDVYWIIPTKKRLYRVPRPFTLGVIFGAFPERVLRYIDEHDHKAFDELGKSLRENALPDVIPTALMGWIEAYSNKSFYTGRSIVPRSEELLEPEMQYSSYTSETAKLVGSVLEYPPRKIDHILKSYGGGLATYGTKIVDGLIKLVDKKERAARPTATSADYPLIGAFTPRVWASSDSIDKFYQKLDDMEREYKTVKKKGYTGPAKKELANYRSIARELAKLRVAAQDVQAHPTMTAKEKREALDVFSIIQINIARKTLGKDPITKEEANIK